MDFTDGKCKYHIYWNILLECNEKIVFVDFCDNIFHHKDFEPNPALPSVDNEASENSRDTFLKSPSV